MENIFFIFHWLEIMASYFWMKNLELEADLMFAK